MRHCGEIWVLPPHSELKSISSRIHTLAHHMILSLRILYLNNTRLRSYSTIPPLALGNLTRTFVDPLDNASDLTQ